MKPYHKIQTVFKRDPATKHKTLLMGEFSIPEFEYLKDCMWEFTEKVDGTNIRVTWDGQDVMFDGRTDNAQIPPFLLTKLMERFDRTKMEKQFGETAITLYGEGYGAKIQKGGGNYISDGVDFILFDVKVGEWWLKREGVSQVANDLAIHIVPIVGYGTLHLLVHEGSAGFKSHWGDFMAEGLVARPRVELKTRSGHRIITKIKYKDFSRTT